MCKAHPPLVNNTVAAGNLHKLNESPNVYEAGQNLPYLCEWDESDTQHRHVISKESTKTKKKNRKSQEIAGAQINKVACCQTSKKQKRAPSIIRVYF